MNHKRKNTKGATRRKNRYADWGGKKSFKRDFLLKQEFKKAFRAGIILDK